MVEAIVQSQIKASFPLITLLSPYQASFHTCATHFLAWSMRQGRPAGTTITT